MKDWVALVVVALAWTVAWSEEPVDKDLRLFMESYQGSFNNHNQVAFERGLPSELQHPWHHVTATRVAAPAFGDHVVFSQISEEGPAGKIIRQRVNVLEPDRESGTIVQTFYAIEPGQEGISFPVDAAAVARLAPDDLRSYPEGCRVVWRRHADQFFGTIDKGDCAVVSSRSGQTLFIYAEMVVAADQYWHLEGGTDEDLNPLFGAPGGVPYKFHRVRTFRCRAQVAADREGRESGSFRDLELIDQGGTAEIAVSAGEARSYRLQLERIVQPAGSEPDVLALTVFDSQAETALATARTEPDAELIGIDLGWLRAGCATD